MSESTGALFKLDLASRERWFVIGILIINALLAIAFSLGPVFEGPDELQHVRMIRFIMENNDLPTLQNSAGFESHQPPVYYVLAAPIKALLDDRDFADYVNLRNPYYDVYGSSDPGNFNKNFYIHLPEEAFPYTTSPTALTFHVLRLLSTVQGTATLVVSYSIFRLILPQRPDLRISALALIAFWPLAVYFSGLVNNNNTLNLFAAISLLLTLRQLNEGPSWRRAILHGFVLGIAILAKVNSVYLAVPVGIAVLTDRRTWPYALATLAATLLVSGWWFARNMQIVGEPSGITLFYDQVPLARVLPGQLTFASWANKLAHSVSIAWALFGSESVPVGAWLRWLFDLVVIASLVGCAVRLARFLRAGQSVFSTLHTRQWLVVSGFAVCWIVALGHMIAVNNLVSHGYLLLPGLPVYGPIIAVGLDAFTAVRYRVRISLSIVSLSLVALLVSLFGYFYPSYRPLAVPAQIGHPILYRYSDVAELIGTDAGEYRAQPGDTITITLYWRALKPASMSMTAFVHSVDSNMVVVESLPGGGNLPANAWKPGQVWAERYQVKVPDDAEPQRVYLLIAGLYDPQAATGFPITNQNNEPVTLPQIGRLVIGGTSGSVTPDYLFGGIVGLANPEVTASGRNVKVCFTWISLQSTETSYTVFVHAINADGQLIGQTDAPPKSGQYPTDVWVPGEVVKDCMTVTTTANFGEGDHLAVGLYDSATGVRLPVVDKDGAPQVNDLITLQP